MSLPGIESSPNVSEYLDDESGLITNGNADIVFFPKNAHDVLAIMQNAIAKNIPVTVSGAGTGISGSRVPLEGWVISTDKMREIDGGTSWLDPRSKIQYTYKLDIIDDDNAFITVPVSIPLLSLQQLARELGWFYPPDPTERSAFIGGNIATNASGARSFKFGATREWVQALEIVLPDGQIITLSRDDTNTVTSDSILINTPGRKYAIPRPSYPLPNTRKNVAGPVITDSSKAIDLFIGTDGIFGIVTKATLRLIRPSDQHVSLFVYFQRLHDVISLVEICANQRAHNQAPVPMSVELLGPNPLKIIKTEEKSIDENAKYLIIMEQDAKNEDELMTYLEFWTDTFEKCNAIDTSVAQTHKEIEYHKHLRHKVPETINTMVRKLGQSKLGTDYSVPIPKFREFLEYVYKIAAEFEEYQSQSSSDKIDFGYALWAHAGDAHVHLNILPRSDEESKYAKKLFLKIMAKVVELGGSIAAEHGLGKKMFNGKPALYFQYGDTAIQEIRKMKEVLDVNFLLNRGNIIGFDQSWIERT